MFLVSNVNLFFIFFVGYKVKKCQGGVTVLREKDENKKKA